MKENNNDKIIRDAQFRKGLSIAFFNSLNSAITLVSGRQIADREEMLKEVIRLRDFFLEEHKTYYATVIANIGQNYDLKETLKKLDSVKNLEELKNVWQSLSEDERHDGEVIKTKNQIKKSYEKN